MKVRKNRFFSIVRLLSLFVVGLGVAVVVTLSQINLEKLRGNLLAVLRDATGMPVEIEGAVSWKLSLRPMVELNKVRIANADWAKKKYGFSADKIDVRLNLISLFRDRPTVQNVRIYNAELNIEKNADGQYSVAAQVPGGEDGTIEKYPFKDLGLGGVEVDNFKADINGERYVLSGFNIRLTPRREGREYAGWIKTGNDVFPFIIALREYNAERKVYPVQVALSTGGEALIANVALEGKSKAPIDFIVKGDVPDVAAFGRIFGWNLHGVPKMKVNIAGGFDRNKITLRRSSVAINGVDFTISGSYDWSKKNSMTVLDVHADRVALDELFPGLYGGVWVRPDRKLNVFKDVPLFGKDLLGKNLDLKVSCDDFFIYRDFKIADLDLNLKLKDNHARVDIEAAPAGGELEIGANADIDADGVIWTQVAAKGEKIYVGEILKQIHKNDFLSDLPMNMELYVLAHGQNLSQIMQTLTGPVRIYSDAPGYAHSALVSYMYGTDFLTSLRHSIQDLFSSEKKYNQIKISCMAVNAMLRDGRIETQNGVAVETNAINIRLAGSLDLGKEELKLALTTVPVRGLKLSLTGNVVNSISLSGSLAEPDIKISGAAVAGKVASATGIGLLLAPFTGGIGLVAGAGLGLVAGDLLENWLADDHPCETALQRGVSLFNDDPEWMRASIDDLVQSVLEN